MRVEQSFSAHTKSMDSLGNILSATIPYIVFETIDEDEALRGVLNTAPRQIGFGRLKSVEISDRADETTFMVNAIYEYSSSTNQDINDENEATMSFSCGGGSVHMNYAYNQRCVYTANGNSSLTDPGVAIEYNNGEIRGVTVPAALFRETYTKEVPLSKITTAYKRKLGKLTGMVNNAPWKGWDAGEVMFMGASFSTPQSVDSSVLVTFDFEIQLNEKNFHIAPGISITKKGYEYAWISSTQTGKDNKNPKLDIGAIYVAQVCKYADFTLLGL